MEITKILNQHIRPPVRLPTALLARFDESTACAPYLVSCFDSATVLYLSPRFETITGYASEQFRAGGLKFWFSVIHPADVQGVANTVTKAHFELANDGSLPPEPLQLEYRIRRPDGSIVWLRELKQIASFREGKKDHILGCFCDISTEKKAEGEAVRGMLKAEKDCNGLLKVAVSYQANSNEADPSFRISARELEVLRLVAAGGSSKQIAAELSITENTVETHRRHLLEKFKVNNSTALVKEAHRLALL